MYTWSTLTIETITNLYLYGQEDTPNLYEERLRTFDQYDVLETDPDDGSKRIRIQLDAESYMTQGAGRYAHAAEIKFVQDFYDGTAILGEGVYTKEDLKNLGFANTDFNFKQEQAFIENESSDYALRSYLYNTTEVTIASDTRFIVEANGSRRVEDMAILPFDDDFDFDAGSTIAQLGNDLILKNKIDPFEIGRQVFIEFINKDNIERIENYNYQQDVIDAANVDYDTPVTLLSEMNAVVAQLKTSGVVEYLTSEDKNVIYGSAEDDNLDGNNDEQDIIVLGDGNDTINSSSGNDLIYGGSDTDTMNYQNLSDQSVTITKSLEAGFEWSALTNTGEKDEFKDIERFILTQLDDVVFIRAEDINTNMEFDGKGQGANTQDILSFENSSEAINLGNADSVLVKYTNFESVKGTSFGDSFKFKEVSDLASGVISPTQNIDALGGEDTIDFSEVTENLSVNSNTIEGKDIAFENIERFILSSATDTFNITEQNTDEISFIDGGGQNTSEGDILNLGSFTSDLKISNTAIDSLDIKTKGFESIILGSGDDEVGPLINKIITTGDGSDVLEVGTNIYITDASFDDRITYAGNVLTGVLKGKESDSQWGIGKFGEEYSINTQGDLVIWTPNMRGDNGEKYFTFAANYQSSIGPSQFSTANITLGEIEVKSSLFFRDNEGISIDDVKNTWNVLGSVTKANTGKNVITGKDPLVLDLDGDGVELTPDLYFAGKFFDLNGDGFAERTGWVSSDDGLLALDVNNNGIIDDISELFGSPIATGFSELAALDSNLDGVIDSNDTQFSDLRVWQDANENAVTDTGELKTLGDLGIVSLGTTPTDTTETQNNGNTIAALGSYTKSDSSTGDIGEVLFANNLYDSQWNGDVTISNDALNLPEISGHGTLTSLRAAMSLDASFATLVQNSTVNFNTPDLEALRTTILPILNGWRNVDVSLPNDAPGMAARSDINIVVSNSSSTGATVEDFIVKKTDTQGDFYEFASGRDVLDAQGQVIARPTEEEVLAHSLDTGESWTQLKGDEIQFFERWLGVPLTFGEEAVSGQASIDATSYMLNLIWNQLNEIVVGIATQDGGLEQYFQGVVYDPEVAKFTATDNRDLAPVFESIFSNAPGTAQADADYIASWKGFLNIVLNNFEREGDLSITHGYLFKNLVTAYENIGLSIPVEQTATLFDIPLSSITTANGQTDLGSQEDIIYLTSGDDVVAGGNDSDTYIIGQNFGNDTINSFEDTLGRGGYDIVRFAHLNASDIMATRNGNDLILTETGTSNVLTIQDQFKGRYPGLTTAFIEPKYAVQEIVFADGEVWTHWDMAYATHEVDPNSSIVIGTRTGDYLDGGAGDDILHGREDGDVYYYGLSYGNDIIDDIGTTDFAGVDKAAFFPLLDAPDILTFKDLNFDDLEFSRDATSNSTLDDLIITVSDTGETLEIVDQFWRAYGLPFGSTDWMGRIEGFVFDDGLQLSADELMEEILENAGTDGNDSIYGFDYSDILNGGAGDDYLSGGNDSDTYIFGLGYGHDTIFENYEQVASDREDTVLFLPDVDHSTVTFDRTSINSEGLIFTLSDGSSLTIEDHFNQYGIAGEFNAIEFFQFQDSNNTLWDNDYIKDQILLAAGTVGDDTIYGFDAGSDILDGGAGNDTLIGENGSDTYRFGVGYGHDVVEEASQAYLAGIDKVEFVGGLNQADVSFTRNGNDIIAEILSTNETITIKNQFSSLSYYRVEEYVLNDVTLDYLDIVEITSQGSTINGDSSNNDPLDGTGGDDFIYGFEGDDVIDGKEGNDVIDGGTGNDQLYGGEGYDNFLFGVGSGHDIIRESASYTSLNDRIIFDETVSDNDIRFIRSTDTSRSSNDEDIIDDLKIEIISTGETIRVDDHFSQSGNYFFNAIGSLDFSNGEVWGNETISERYIADNTTDGNDNIIGFELHDEYLASAGDDIINGYSGNDTYYWSSGMGNDYIEDTTRNLGNGHLNDRIIFEGLNFNDLYFAGVGEDFQITNKLTNEILTVGQQVDSFYFYEIDSFVFEDETYTYDQIFNHIFNSATPNTINGTINNDNLVGTYRNDILNGNDGDDTLSGGEDDDILNGNDGHDILNGNDQNDILNGGAGDDTLNGGDDNDVLNGDEGNDILNGGRDDDILYGGNGNDSLVGGAGNDTLNGDAGDDTLNGGDDNDTLYGGDGDDIINGNDGDDEHFGGAGNDLLIGNFGADNYYGGTGSDTLDLTYYNFDANIDLSNEIITFQTGSTGIASSIENIIAGNGDNIITGNTSDNIINAGNGNNAVIGGAGNDTLYGESGDDSLIGGDGDDTLSGGAGLDSFDGGAGSDTADFTYSSSDVDFDLTKTSNQVEFSGGTIEDLISIENITGSSGVNNILGDAQNNILDGYTEDDMIDGGDGDDTIIGGEGDDTLTGGAGFDSFVFKVLSETTANTDHITDFSADDEINLSAITGLNFIGLSEFTNTANEMRFVLENGTTTIEIDHSGDGLSNHNIVLDNGEYALYEETEGSNILKMMNMVNGTANDDNNLAGSANVDFIRAYEGDDLVYGGAGNDTLIGGAGNDDLRGQDGVDTNYAGDGDDFILGGVGDIIYGEAGNDVMRGYGGVGLFNGGAGTDKAWWRDYQHTYQIGMNINLLSGLVTDGNNNVATISEIEDITGSVYADTITGDDNTNLIRGGSNRFGLIDGNDTIYGEGGDDWLYGDSGDDTIHGGDGIDRIYGLNDNDVLYGDAGNDIMDGGAGNDEFHGGLGNDLINARTGNDILYGDEGNDNMRGHEGLDTLYGGIGNDILNGGSENDSLYGEEGADTLLGGTGNDILYGGDDAVYDLLKGEDGDDTFFGGGGQDKHIGGDGADNFIFENASDYAGNAFNRIDDFDTAEGDTITISNLLSGYDPLNDLLSDFVDIVDNGTHTYLRVDEAGASNFNSVIQLVQYSGHGNDADDMVANGSLIV